MVEQNRSGAYQQIAYSPLGSKLAMMNGQALIFGYVPLPGGALAQYTSVGTAYYRHPDWLGSARLVSLQTGTNRVFYDGAISPFGVPYAGSGTTDVSFTGMNQDTSSNLYDFPAREYGIQGRWPSPDPAGMAAVDPSNPQTWNRYAYVTNGPLNAIDPNGLDEVRSIFSTDCVWYSCYQGGPVANGDYGGANSGFTQGISMSGLLWENEARNEERYLGWLEEWKAQAALASSGAGADTIIVHCDELNIWNISCDPPPQALLGSKTWYSPFFDSDAVRLAAVSQRVVRLAQGPINVMSVAFVAETGGILVVEAPAALGQLADSPALELANETVAPYMQTPAGQWLWRQGLMRSYYSVPFVSTAWNWIKSHW
jgi:RHS repeat-associated protein